MYYWSINIIIEWRLKFRIINLCVCLLIALGPIYSQEEFIEGRYMLQPLGSTRYLDVSGSCEHLNGCKVQLYGIGKSPKNNTFLIQKSQFARTFGRPFYNIICVSNNKALDADYSRISTEGCRVQVWDIAGPPIIGDIFKGNQDFGIIRVGQNQYHIYSAFAVLNSMQPTSRLLGVPRSQTNRNKTQVGLYSITNRNASVIWVLTRVN